MTVSTYTISIDDPQALRHARQILSSGGLVAFPTDTVYGVGALLDDPAAVERLFDAKDRPEDKPIPVLLADAGQLDRVAGAVGAEARALVERFWPGPLTVVVAGRSGLPQPVAPQGTVGVRVPDHEFARRLLKVAGPMAATSANLSGNPSAVTADEVSAELSGRIDLILDGGRTPGGTASTVVDCSGDQLRILRVGPISAGEIQAALGR